MKPSDVYRRPGFVVAISICAAFLLLGIVATDAFASATKHVFDWMITNLGWAFILSASAFLLVVVALFVSRVGAIRLGRDDEEPEYSTLTWFAMLFSCGMGIGLLFWGVSEPISHYAWPPLGDPRTAEAGHIALRYAFFHWGLHPWGIYAVVGGALAYASYRRGLPMLLSSTLEPILGRENLDRGWGTVVNIIGVFATLFGLGTSLGLGAMQIGAGVEALSGFASTQGLWVAIVVAMAVVALASTMSGIDRGIKYLSQVNIGVAACLMLLVFILGPTLFILNSLTHATGDYLQNIIGMSSRIDATGEGAPGWTGAWTVFYWAWWIAWAPFVGAFIARISKGRTLRQFVTGVLLIPTSVSLAWFSVFGGSAVFAEHFGGAGGAIIEAVSASEASGFFALLGTLPGSQMLIFVAMFSVAVFFITSLASGTYVNSMLTSGGNPNPPMPLRVTWGAFQGGVAAILLFTGGERALESLQTASLVGGFPFMIVMLLMVYCLFTALSSEARGQRTLGSKGR